MFKLIERFIGWTLDVEPTWVGFTVFISAVLFACVAIFIAIVVLPPWLLLLVLGPLVLHAWVKALFFQ